MIAGMLPIKFAGDLAQQSTCRGYPNVANKFLSWLSYYGSDVATLFQHPMCVMRAFGNADLESVRGRVQSAESAEQLLDTGYTILVDNVSTLVPSFAAFERNVESDFGIPPQTCAVKLSFTPAGSRVQWHFDRHDSFQVHLLGTKTWATTPNLAAPSPLHGYFEGSEAHAELLSYATGSLAPAAEEQTVQEMCHGTIMFVPRGWWHSTRAEGDSLSVIIRLAVPAWMQLLPVEYRQQAVCNVAWRQPAYYTWGPEGDRAGSTERLNALLCQSGLQRQLDAEQLISSFNIAEFFECKRQLRL